MKQKKRNRRHALFPLFMVLTLLLTLPTAIAAAKPTSQDTSQTVTEPAPSPEAPVEPVEEPDVMEENKPAEKDNPETPVTLPDTEPEETPEPEQEPLTVEELFSTTLFIGDSRTVGLSEYAGLPATFFADVGMTVYSAFDKEISVAGVGKVTLSDLLSQQKFDRIHLMLGINELGYDMDTTVKQYASVLEQIGVLQPDATIYLGANLHVDAARSQSDAIFNNTRINQFNQQVAAMADGKDVIYLDVNPLFDDESGCLRSDLTGDGTHVYGSSYVTWGQWLYEQMQ